MVHINEKVIPRKLNKTMYANDFKCKNLWNSKSYQVGQIGADGNVNPAIDSWGSSFIEVNPSTTYTFRMTASAYQQRLLCTYASDGTLIARVYQEFTDDTDTYTFTTPSNCNKVGISWRIDLNSSNKQLELGSSATSYTPYKDFSGEIYSTEEIVVGKWIDGKPLYRKVLIFPNGTGSTVPVYYNLSSDFGINNVSEIFMVHPSFYMLDDLRVPFNYHDGTKYEIQVSGSTLVVSVGYSQIASSRMVITLEYTKTTD